MALFKKLSTQALFAQYMTIIRPLDRDWLLIFEDLLTNLGIVLNQGISFEHNFDGEEVTGVADATPDTEFTIAHTLDRIPTRFIVTDTDAGGVVYRSGTAWTDDTVYLKCTVASANLKVLVY